MTSSGPSSPPQVTAWDEPARETLMAGRQWLEEELRQQGWISIAGVDEAGRGPLAGPVVAAAVWMPEDFDASGIDDSKKLAAATREKLYARIIAGALVGVGMAGVEEIDAGDIRRAALEAMSRALAELLGRGARPQLVLVDGRDEFSPPPGHSPIPQRAVVRGDSRCRTVAAASIVAKVHRDRLMVEYHRRWPQYGFDRHKGYPTAAHFEALRRYGPCPIHRRTFRGVLS